MTYSSDNPFSHSSAMSKNNGLVPTNASRMALDNLLRRELKVGDPNNSQEIAQALFARYKDTPKATAIIREAEGVPFLTAPTPVPIMQGMTSSDAEMQQAVDDVNRDLQELTTNTILKDITPELQGWAVAIRSSITEGFNAARFALDRMQRDKVFGIRRNLNDYARMARLVGALTPSTNVYYRKLAQSLDEVAAVLLVMMGEALANVGFGSGRFLLQVPYSELQVRRDAAINALRNLLGSAQQVYEPNEWQRGLHAYRKLFKYLEDRGQGDLRVLLLENELSRIMDELIHRAANGRVEGLRALGATAQLDLERLRRLVIISQATDAGGTDAPSLATFLDSLLLFVEAFDSSGGFRLLRIARPSILTYGLYGTSGLDSMAEDILVDLVLYRGRLADQLDCFLQCDCSPERVTGQVILDKILYDVDRAIDLYAMGTTTNKDTDLMGPERRATAYGYVINAGLDWLTDPLLLQPLLPKTSVPMSNPPQPPLFKANPLYLILNTIQRLLLLTNQQPPLETNPSTARIHTPISVMDLNNILILDSLMQQELCIQKTLEKRWINLVKTLAPGCIPFIGNANNGSSGVFGEIEMVIDDALKRVNNGNSVTCPLVDVQVARHLDTSIGGFS